MDNMNNMDNVRYSFYNTYGDLPGNITGTVEGVSDHNVEEIEIPSHWGESTIVAISQNAFHGCTKLKRVSMPDCLLKYYIAFEGTPVYEIIRSRYIEYAKKNFEKLDEWNCPEYLTVYDDVFANCGKLTAVKLPRRVTELNGTFKGCINLKVVKLPQGNILNWGGISSIEKAFQGCASLTRIFIPSSVKSAKSALEDCQNLEEVVMEGAYLAGDIFGDTTNDNVKRIVCLSPSLTAIGSAPNATIFVPYKQKEVYKRGLEEYNEILKANGKEPIQFAEIKELYFYKGEDPIAKEKAQEEAQKAVVEIFQEEEDEDEEIRYISEFTRNQAKQYPGKG